MITLRILDEINCQFEGLSPSDKKTIRDKIALPVKGAFTTAAYKVGAWDGKEANFDQETGITFLHLVEDILDVLEINLGYDLDNDIELINEHEGMEIPDLEVDKNFLIEEFGHTLRDHQEEGINTVLREKKGILEYATSAGKAQPVWSNVMTPEGWKKIGDISVGDFVIGKDGYPVRVSGVFPQGKKEVFRVVMSHGEETHCCGEHLWSVRTKYSSYRGGKFKVKSLYDIMGDYKTENQGNRWQIPIVEPIDFDRKHLCIDPYALGFLIGDGAISTESLSISNPEEDIIEIFSSKLGGDTLSYRNGLDYGIKGGNTRKKLIDLGLMYKKSEEKFIPDDYLNSSIEDRAELLRGLMDTDGYVYRNDSIEYVTVSENLARDVQYLVRSLGGQCYIGVKETPSYTYKGDKRIGQTAYRLNIRFGKDRICPVSSKKHLERYNPNSKINNTIDLIEQYGEEECVCIMVESDDHLYVTDDFILTHNTQITVGISKALDPYLKTIVIVPSENLVDQTIKDYEKTNLNAFALKPKTKPKDRPAVFEKYDHIIITAKLFLNCVEFVRGKKFALILDEIHKILGPVLAEAVRFDMSQCPVRIGLTATVPSDKLKKQTILCHLGGGILDKVSAKELIDKDYAANVSINMIHTVHREMEDLSNERDDRGNRVWEWDMEEDYLATHRGRIESIADYISSLEQKNTLVLCHPRLGKEVCQFFDGRMVSEETPVETRQDWYSQFDNGDDNLLFCSYATSGTGLSINRVHRLIIVDVGKNEANIIQGIGRGMRLSENNDVEVIDISAKTYYSNKHEKERVKIYKREQYEFKRDKNYIQV